MRTAASAVALALTVLLAGAGCTDAERAEPAQSGPAHADAAADSGRADASPDAPLDAASDTAVPGDTADAASDTSAPRTDTDAAADAPDGGDATDSVAGAGTRAMWVWNETPSIQDLLAEDPAARDALLDFAQAPHGQPSRSLNRVFLEARAKTSPDKFAELFTVTYDPLTDADAAAGLRAFLAEASRRGIAVEYLDGQAIWLATDQAAEVPKQICRDVAAFNRDSPAGQRLAGVHLDIEPHTVTSGPWAGHWWQDRLDEGYNAEWTRRFLEILASCRQTLDDYAATSGHRVTLAVDLGTDYGFYNKPLLEALNAADGPVDYVTIMNYFDNRPNADGQPSFFWGDFDGANVVGGVVENLGFWTEPPVLFAMETGPPSIATDAQSFYQEGWAVMYGVVDELTAGYADQNLLGVAIHHYAPDSYAALPEGPR